jgi:hypothetical protein
MKLKIRIDWDTDAKRGWLRLHIHRRVDMSVVLRSPLHAAQVLIDVILGYAPTKFSQLGQNLQFGQTPPEQPWASVVSADQIQVLESQQADSCRSETVHQ